MTCTVKVKDGIIALPAGLSLPDGSEVQLIIPDSETAGTSFAERYAAYIGAADGLPVDLAEHLDHHVHGQDKG